MIVEIIGYIGYSILLFYAVTGLWGIRLFLGISIHTINSILLAVVCVVLMPALDISFVYSYAFMVAIIVFTYLSSHFSASFPTITKILKVPAVIVASIIRIGISREKIEREFLKSNLDFVNKKFDDETSPEETEKLFEDLSEIKEKKENNYPLDAEKGDLEFPEDGKLHKAIERNNLKSWVIAILISSVLILSLDHNFGWIISVVLNVSILLVSYFVVSFSFYYFSKEAEEDWQEELKRRRKS